MKGTLLVVAALVAAPVSAQPKPADDKGELLSAAQIKSTVDSHLADVKGCMKENGGATGKLVVLFGVLPDGHTGDVKVKQASSNAKLDGCIAGLFRKWQFPKRASGPFQGEEYPFVFAAPKPQVDTEAEMKAIAGVINGHLGEVKKCDEEALKKNEKAAGTVNVEITIAPTGAVGEAKLKDSNTKIAELDQCIVKAVKTWTFAKPQGGANVTFVYPFVLNPPKEVKKDEKKDDKKDEKK